MSIFLAARPTTLHCISSDPGFRLTFEHRRLIAFVCDLGPIRLRIQQRSHVHLHIRDPDQGDSIQGPTTRRMVRLMFAAKASLAGFGICLRARLRRQSRLAGALLG